MADEICERMAHGETLNNICADDHLPASHAVSKLRRSHAWFDSAFLRAREDQMFAWCDQIVTIADDRSQDILYDKDGKPVLNGQGDPKFNRGHPDRDRLRIQTRQWIMKSILPQVFGDRQIVDMNYHFEDKDDSELLNQLKIAAETSGFEQDDILKLMTGELQLQ